VNPLAAGVSVTLAYRVDRERPGGPGRLAVKRAGMAVRERERAARAEAAAARERRVLGLLAPG
jgi:hypothetical protein